MKKLLLLITIIVTFSGCILFMTGESGIEIYNNLEFTQEGYNNIDQLYCKKQSSTDWGSNYMAYSIGAGYDGTIGGLPVGVYDLKAVTTSGVEYIKEDIDLVDAFYDDIYIWTIP